MKQSGCDWEKCVYSGRAAHVVGKGVKCENHRVMPLCQSQSYGKVTQPTLWGVGVDVGSVGGVVDGRPGRPPKRPHEILGMGGMPGPMGPGGLPPPHLSPEALMALKKTRMDAREFPPFLNGGVPDNDMEKSPLLSNGYNPPPKGLMAQYMALNGGMPHPALLAHTGLPLPPHPAPWAAHAAEHPFKNGPHPDNIPRTMMWENCRASYDEVLKQLERYSSEGCKDTFGYGHVQSEGVEGRPVQHPLGPLPLPGPGVDPWGCEAGREGAECDSGVRLATYATNRVPRSLHVKRR
ncbi:hypothetical protein Pmani_025604 [Petrolisthes manimaculis]|uniref:Uncharacterized protein n=1 Tax=Petrolisthes manimaculis TaxID=1843537 RepID=A0AAE1P579_9EUCA|nr:hypothetical protein Pmani_025604 [Petrolisthes manimaculis]